MIETVSIQCDLLTRMGRAPVDGVPIGALTSWVQELQAKIPPEELPTFLVYGTEHLVARGEHSLTPLEEAQHIAAQRLTDLRTLSAIVQRSQDHALSLDERSALDALLGRYLRGG